MSGGFFAMGGYGAYIWPAYGLTVLAMIWLLWWSLRRRRGLRRLVATIEGQAITPSTRDTQNAVPRRDNGS